MVGADRADHVRQDVVDPSLHVRGSRLAGRAVAEHVLVVDLVDVAALSDEVLHETAPAAQVEGDTAGPERGDQQHRCPA